MMTERPSSPTSSTGRTKVDPARSFPKSECQFPLSSFQTFSSNGSRHSQLTETLTFRVYNVQFTWDLNIWPLSKLNKLSNIHLSLKTEVQDYALLTVALEKANNKCERQRNNKIQVIATYYCNSKLILTYNNQEEI